MNFYFNGIKKYFCYKINVKFKGRIVVDGRGYPYSEEEAEVYFDQASRDEVRVLTKLFAKFDS